MYLENGSVILDKNEACGGFEDESGTVRHGIWRRAGQAAGHPAGGLCVAAPVLRINAEVREGCSGYVEFNTAVEKDGVRGWLNIGFWNDVPYERDGKTVTFKTDFLEIRFTGVGIEGSCPAEKDNAGCFFLGEGLRAPELIASGKEFCDCAFRWSFTTEDAYGVSIGKTLPAYPTEVKTVYPKEAFTVENAAKIPCQQVLGTYVVRFQR